MKLKEVNFVGSFEHEFQCPKDIKPEYAFIGRSNVGKSSLINMLCNRKGIAKVSNTPGKTQTINYFNVDENWHLVDLPGYGYAKISKKMRAKWEKMIERYLVTRGQLQCVFVLIDSRHTLQTIDIEFMNWLGDRRVPFVIVYTKIDKLTKKQVEKNIDKIQNGIKQFWNDLPTQFITSAEKAIGREDILSFIGDLNNKF
ncbi:MAG: ribosome biogenesis GTP-binding protein YihA/YsxC [Saprospiraceae bacterium]